jgi:RNA polymerase sigma-70 factor (ECF subfamily)
VTNKTDTLTDRQLVEKVLTGDTSAFATIIKNTEALVAQIVFKMVDNIEDRKDLAQDIYLKAYKNLPGFRFGSKLSTWIAQVSYNTCLDYLRKKKLVLQDTVHDDGDEDLPGINNKYSLELNVGADKDIFRKELSGILKTEIDRLPVIYKTLITLYHNEEMSYDEIAQITQLPEGTLKNYLFRARKALKNSLLQHYKKEDL